MSPSCGKQWCAARQFHRRLRPWRRIFRRRQCLGRERQQQQRFKTLRRRCPWKVLKPASTRSPQWYRAHPFGGVSCQCLPRQRFQTFREQHHLQRRAAEDSDSPWLTLDNNIYWTTGTSSPTWQWNRPSSCSSPRCPRSLMMAAHRFFLLGSPPLGATLSTLTGGEDPLDDGAEALPVRSWRSGIPGSQAVLKVGQRSRRASLKQHVYKSIPEPEDEWVNCVNCHRLSPKRSQQSHKILSPHLTDCEKNAPKRVLDFPLRDFDALPCQSWPNTFLRSILIVN
jgi:hypothetical protein